MSRWGTSPSQGARAVVDWACLELRPGLDLGLLARLLGADTIAHRSLVADGTLTWENQKRVLALRRGCIPERQRFTLAHEIGHLLIEQRFVVTPPPSNVETWCNQFAAELLAPRDWVFDAFRDAPHEIATARDLAEVASVSMSMAITRLRDVCMWSEALIHWRRVDRHWTYNWAVGIRPAERRMLRELEPRAYVQSGGLKVNLRGEQVSRHWTGELHFDHRSLLQLSTANDLALQPSRPDVMRSSLLD